MALSTEAVLVEHLPERVTIPAGGVHLPGILTLPANPKGMVVFAHGSGSSRLSSRNRLVSDGLVRGGFGTLLFDLLAKSEERNRSTVFDIPLLAQRLRCATEWVAAYPPCAGLPIGYFGASTGAAAALVAAASHTAPEISAVVSRGGRPDLTGDGLMRVRAPTLLIVGGADEAVLALNQNALAHLPGIKRLVVVPGATHLFEEPGALSTVAAHALSWFRTHLQKAARRETA